MLLRGCCGVVVRGVVGLGCVVAGLLWGCCAGVVGAGSVVAGFVCERACRGASVTRGSNALDGGNALDSEALHYLLPSAMLR